MSWADDDDPLRDWADDEATQRRLSDREVIYRDWAGDTLKYRDWVGDGVVIVPGDVTSRWWADGNVFCTANVFCGNREKSLRLWTDVNDISDDDDPLRDWADGEATQLGLSIREVIYRYWAGDGGTVRDWVGDEDISRDWGDVKLA